MNKVVNTRAQDHVAKATDGSHRTRSKKTYAT